MPVSAIKLSTATSAGSNSHQVFCDMAGSGLRYWLTPRLNAHTVIASSVPASAAGHTLFVIAGLAGFDHARTAVRINGTMTRPGIKDMIAKFK